MAKRSILILLSFVFVTIFTSCIDSYDETDLYMEYERGYNDGYEQGSMDRYEEGYNDGCIEGGYWNGYDDAWEEIEDLIEYRFIDMNLEVCVLKNDDVFHMPDCPLLMGEYSTMTIYEADSSAYLPCLSCIDI